MLIRQLFTFIFLFITSSLLWAESTTEFPDELVKKTITAFMEKNQVPGVAVQVYVDGKPRSYFFGYANKEKKLPVTKNTIFEVGSISKVMTSILFAQEIDMANMGLHDPANKYLTLPSNYNKITLQDLATHTSGLPFNPPETIKDRLALDKYFQETSPNISPEEEWNYSNMGIGLLGYALENVTHKDFDQLYRRHILNPLKMHPVALNVPKAYQRFYAQGYGKNGEPVERVELGLFPAAYGLKVVAGDMQSFLSAAIGLPNTPTRLLYPIKMTQTAYVKLPNELQGLGWQIHELDRRHLHRLLDGERLSDLGPIEVEDVFEDPLYKNDVLIDKTGVTKGFRAYIALIPNKKTGIVILANRSLSDNSIAAAGRNILFKINNLG